MKLFVVRHGESEANAARIHSGWGAFHLTEKGREQARETRKALSGMHFDRILVSDLVRTQETAQILVPERVGDFELRSDVREYNMGQFVGVSVEEMKKRFGEPYLKMLAQQDYSAIGCEEPEHFVERVSGMMREMEEYEGNVLLVTHEGVGKCIEQYVVGTPFRQSRMKTVNCGVSVLEYKNGFWKILCWNYTPTLERFC